MAHYDEMTCLLYLDGQLDSVRAGQLASHAQGCAECRRLLHALERESAHLREALTEEAESVPAHLLAPPERQVGSWAWIVSFGLATAGAWTLWTGFVEPWQQQLNDAGFGGGNLLAMLFFSGVFWEGWGTMATMLQVLATISLGILAAVVFRRQWRRLLGAGSGPGMTLWIAASLAVILALPPAAGAAEIQHKHGSYTLAEGQTVANDLILLGIGTARIDGTVDGDLIMFGQSLTINGRVKGDVISFTHSLRIYGEVEGDVRSITNSIVLRGTVGKNVMIIAETVETESAGRVNGSLMAFYQTGTLEARAERDVMVFADTTALNGYIGGSAQLRGRSLSIGPSAEILGKTKWSGQKEAQVDGAAKLASPLEFELRKRAPDYASPRFYWRQALRWGAAFVFGLVVLLVAPGFFDDAVRSSRRYGAAIGFGALALVSTPILAIIVCITIVGIAVALGGLLAWALALYASQVFVGAWLGEKLLGDGAGTAALLGRLALGLLVIRVAGNIPYAGGWIWFAVILWGMGAIVLAVVKRMRSTGPAEPAVALAA